MRIVCDIPIDENGARAVWLMLEALVAVWAPYLKANPLPPLYESGVRYQAEPNAGEYEDFKSPLRTYAEGWGDCDDLIIYRCAELRAAGELATVQCMRKVGTSRMHVRVRRQNGLLEDPSIEIEKQGKT